MEYRSIRPRPAPAKKTDVRRNHSGCSALALAFVAGSAAGQEVKEPEVAWSADLGVSSRYLFSGLEFSSGSVTQAGLTMTYGGLSVSGFTNYDVRTNELNEADLSANYHAQISEKVGMYVGAALYHFQNLKQHGKWDPTTELFFGLSTSYPGNPSIHYARDYELTAGGQLLQLSLSQDVGLGPISVTAAGTIAYNDNYYRAGSDVSHYDLSLATRVELGNVTMTPAIVYQNAIADDFSNHWVGALNFNTTF